jgi:hypothetical protein
LNKQENNWWSGSVLNTTLCDKVCQWLVTGRWFSPGTPVSSTNKTDRHDITKILFNVALNTIALALLYIAHNVQDCSVLYNNAVRQVELVFNSHVENNWLKNRRKRQDRKPQHTITRPPTLLSWLGIGISIKSGGVKLALWAQTSLLSEAMEKL